jgi:hypothetical protein
MARARRGSAMALKNAAAICDLPALCTQAKITVTGAARSGFMTTDQHDLRE